MFGAQPGDPVFHARIERIVSGAHIGEFRIGAIGRHLVRRQDRICRPHGIERDIGMPQQVSPVKCPARIVRRMDPTVFVQVADIHQFIGRQPYPAPGNGLLHFLAHQGAEDPSERDVVFVLYRRGVTKNAHSIPVHRRDEFVFETGRRRNRKIHAGGFRRKGRMKPVERYHRGAGYFPKTFFSSAVVCFAGSSRIAASSRPR